MPKRHLDPGGSGRQGQYPLGAQRGQVLGANRAKTGDESDLLLWMTLMMASAAGLLAAFKKRKRA